MSGGRSMRDGWRVPLQEALLGGQTVEGVVRLAVATDGTRERERDVLARRHAIGIHLGNVNLHGGMVLGSDEAVGGRASREE